jgi:signal recognition particle subunit SRP54
VVLGRGDVVGLIRRFEEVVGEEKAEQDALRMLEGKFDLNDFFDQIGVLQKMGPLKEMVEAIPGMADTLPEGAPIGDDELARIKSMISSMTLDEKTHPERFIVTSREELLEGGERKTDRAPYDTSRLARVARGSGQREQEVADLLNRFATLRQVMMQIGTQSGVRTRD